MILNYLGIISGLVLLVFGADKFVQGAANTARGLGMSPLIIGMTIVGFATSAPEILVGTVAAFDGKTEIAIGNALGSNIANIGLVLGIAVIIKPIVVMSRTLKREYIIMALAIIIAFILSFNLSLDRFDACFLLLCLLASIYGLIRIAKISQISDPLNLEFEQELSRKSTLGKSVLALVLGLLLLLGGAELLVKYSVIVAQSFGMSDLVIGLTIIAVGTSLPELAATIAGIMKNEPDIAVGNVIGSNMFNMLVVISVPVLIQPTEFESIVIWRDFIVMIGFTLIMGWMIYFNRSEIRERFAGGFLLIGFITYQYWLLVQTASG